MRHLVVGGAGFIGSRTVTRLLLEKRAAAVTIYDNYSSEPESADNRLRDVLDHPGLTIAREDVKDVCRLTEAMRGCDMVWHFASNPDIAKAMTDPTVDFREGTALTQNVAEAMRVSGTTNLIYASGSGVYGDAGEIPTGENFTPMHPVSTYGASKLAGEALICSYCYMFGMTARVYRFANVVGPGQTHGVGFDFARRLRTDPSRLRILGDGRQSKSYIHVDDVLDAIFHTESHAAKPFDVYNVATENYITVREIADLSVELAGLRSEAVAYEFTGGDRGWKGDVPVVRFDLSKILETGWHAKRGSRDALAAAIRKMLEEPV